MSDISTHDVFDIVLHVRDLSHVTPNQSGQHHQVTPNKTCTKQQRTRNATSRASPVQISDKSEHATRLQFKPSDTSELPTRTNTRACRHQAGPWGGFCVVFYKTGSIVTCADKSELTPVTLSPVLPSDKSEMTSNLLNHSHQHNKQHTWHRLHPTHKRHKRHAPNAITQACHDFAVDASSIIYRMVKPAPRCRRWRL